MPIDELAFRRHDIAAKHIALRCAPTAMDTAYGPAAAHTLPSASKSPSVSVTSKTTCPIGRSGPRPFAGATPIAEAQQLFPRKAGFRA